MKNHHKISNSIRSLNYVCPITLVSKYLNFYMYFIYFDVQHFSKQCIYALKINNKLIENVTIIT